MKTEKPLQLRKVSLMEKVSLHEKYGKQLQIPITIAIIFLFFYVCPKYQVLIRLQPET